MVFNIVFFILSVITACIAWHFQTKYNKENLSKIEKVKTLFLPKEGAGWPYSLVQEKDTKVIACSTDNEKLSTLIAEQNDYIRKNIGTTDFAIIQNKTERYAKLVYEDAVSNISFPTLIGLMGTFLGVLLGLIGFEFGDILSLFGLDIVYEDQTKISNLVYGVMVSMSTSLYGLFITTKTNYQATKAKKILDENKNVFYDFIQIELMPTLGTSIVVALSKLRETLNSFGPTFNSVVDRFKTTFDTCTANFGEEFQKNSLLLTRSVVEMGKTVGHIDQNIKNQKELLEEIRSNDMGTSLMKFIEAADRLGEASETIESFVSVKKDLQNSVGELVNMQQEYLKSLVVPKTIAERLNNILNRVTTFEESINNLGKAIDSTEMITSSEIRTITAHLESINRKNQLAQEYADTEDEKLSDLYARQVEAINDLNKKYRSNIEEHGEAFESMITELDNAIRDKKNEFLSALENAFSIADINTEFKQLNTLPDIKQKLEELRSIVVEKEVIIKQLTDVKDEIHASSKAVSESVDELKTPIAKSTEAIVPSIKDGITEIAAKIESLIVNTTDNTNTTNSLITETSDSQHEQLKNILNMLMAIEKKFESSYNKSDIEEQVKKIVESVNSLKKDNQYSSELAEISTKIEDLISKVNDNVKNTGDIIAETVGPQREQMHDIVETLHAIKDKQTSSDQADAK